MTEHLRAPPALAIETAGNPLRGWGHPWERCSWIGPHLACRCSFRQAHFTAKASEVQNSKTWDVSRLASGGHPHHKDWSTLPRDKKDLTPLLLGPSTAAGEGKWDLPPAPREPEGRKRTFPGGHSKLATENQRTFRRTGCSLAFCLLRSLCALMHVPVLSYQNPPLWPLPGIPACY